MSNENETFLNNELNGENAGKKKSVVDKYKVRKPKNIIIFPDIPIKKVISNNGGVDKQNVEDERGR